MGITIAGSGVGEPRHSLCLWLDFDTVWSGGVVFPILFRFLFARIGFGWSVRVYGFLVLVLCTIGNATITSRIRPGGQSVPPIPDAKMFRDTPFLLLVAGCFFVNFGQ